MIQAKIYALVCPIKLVPVYVGQTIRPLKRRLYFHVYNNSGSKFKRIWTEKLKENSLSPIIFELESVNLSRANFRERFYINKYRKNGFRLFNCSIPITNRRKKELYQLTDDQN